MVKVQPAWGPYAGVLAMFLFNLDGLEAISCVCLKEHRWTPGTYGCEVLFDVIAGVAGVNSLSINGLEIVDRPGVARGFRH